MPLLMVVLFMFAGGFLVLGFDDKKKLHWLYTSLGIILSITGGVVGNINDNMRYNRGVMDLYTNKVKVVATTTESSKLSIEPVIDKDNICPTCGKVHSCQRLSNKAIE